MNEITETLTVRAAKSTPFESLIDQVILGDSLELLTLLPDGSLSGIVIDPPYGEGMGYAGDGSIQEATELLHRFCVAALPKTARSGHLRVFWTMRNLDRAIETVKSAGWTYRRFLSMYVPRGGARPYMGWLPRTQPILVAQRYLPSQPSDFHAELASYLNDALNRSIHSRNSLAKALGCDSRLVMKWTRVGDPAWCLPTPRFYPALKEALSLDDRYDCLLDRESQTGGGGRGDYSYRHDTYTVDEKRDENYHVSQKPLSVVEHLVECAAPLGEIVYDGFAGSGTTAIAALRKGRRFIASEINPEFHEIAARRVEFEKNLRRAA